MSFSSKLRRSFSSSRSRSPTISSTSSSRSSDRSKKKSRSRSRSKSSSSSISKSSSYSSDFSSKSDKETNFRESKKSFTSSKESLTSFVSLNSIAETVDEFEPDDYQNLPLNVLQLLLSIRETEINIKKQKLKHEINQVKMKISIEHKAALEDENEKLAEEILKESIGVIPLNEVVYGPSHLKSAWSYINLALNYLECKNLPKQAKINCEKAWMIQIQNLKVLENECDLVDQKHEMINNFVYGRSCTLLKENKEAEAALEKAVEHFYNWRNSLQERSDFKKMKSQVFKWQKKIFFAMAKIYAINANYANALEYYENVIDILRKRKQKILNLKEQTNLVESLNEIDLLFIDAYEDKSKIEQNKENFVDAVDYAKNAIEIAETNGSELLLANCKFSLAKIYSQLEDITSATHAENTFKECIEMYEKLKYDEKIIKAEDEMVKFFLKQDRFDEGCNLLNSLIKKQIDFYGDFSLKVSSSYQVLCSVHLKRNDMPAAAKYLQKSYELEELNHGPKHKKTLATKATLDNLKKNPNVAEKLTKVANKLSDKPSFKAANRIDYSKNDKKLYSNATADEEAIKKYITPIK